MTASRRARRRGAIYALLAVVDLGSNSFRLEVGRAEGGQIFRLDTWREPVRLGAYLDRRGRITAEGQRAALACLARFSERLHGLHPSAVRAVATHTFRVATNATAFLLRAEHTLGFPIDVIPGQEEARLIYAGVTRVLPHSAERRLVIDIGGGSTELIVGHGASAERLASFPLGCVSVTQRYFPGGRITARAFETAEAAARSEVEAIAGELREKPWQAAYASSGTALALAEILEANGMSAGGITPEGLTHLRRAMIAARSPGRLALAALKPERAPVLAGGLAVMGAALAELGVRRLQPVGGALRLGVLYDLLGRTQHHDARSATIERFMVRYQVDRGQAARVAATASALYRRVATPVFAQYLEWAAQVHEIGIQIAHLGFHRHGAYILANADMPGFSVREQQLLSRLVLGCRGGLGKVRPELAFTDFRNLLVALRLAVIIHHGRRSVALPRILLEARKVIRVGFPTRWLRAHPLTDLLLAREREEWTHAGHRWRSPPRS
ncbi:MAG: exopolyphosphatase [Casimicrobiaceae bacterium]